MNKIMIRVASFAALLVASVSFADSIRAGYEVVLTKGEDTWQATTVVPVEAGKAIQQGLGPYVVSMNVQEEKEDKYTLVVRVTGQPGSAAEGSEFLRHSFPGSHTERLEFSASEGGLAVKGAIFVGSPKSVAQQVVPADGPRPAGSARR